MRAALLALILLAFPFSVRAATYTEGVSNFYGTIRIWASDGISTVSDQQVYSWGGPDDISQPDHFFPTIETLLEETGTVGVITPVRVFSGHSRSVNPNLEWNGWEPGQISRAQASVVFTTFETYMEGAPLVGLRVDGQEGGISTSATTTASLTVIGSVLLGGDVYPFSFQQGGYSAGGGGTGNPDFIRVSASFGNPDIFSFQRQGITYTGQLMLHHVTLIPEPGTALLLGLGLMGLSASRVRTRPRT